jgi:hypothetical protein
MSDLELYIYIGLILIYFLTRVLKKKKTPGPPGNYRDSASNKPESDQQPARERPMTFEELLQEFTGYKEPPQSAMPEVVEEKVIEEQDETVEEDQEYHTYEGYEDYKTSGYTNYEELYKRSQDLTTLDEKINLEEPIEKQFEPYDTIPGKHERARKYRQMLMKRESIRDAFILKEILDPKYL